METSLSMEPRTVLHLGPFIEAHSSDVNFRELPTVVMHTLTPGHSRIPPRQWPLTAPIIICQVEQGIECRGNTFEKAGRDGDS